jgi:ABC-type sugar transport system ATPase subunit
VIELEQVTVHAGSFTLRDASLCVPQGHYGVLMGKTGCGKTTLLEAVLGLKRVSKGRIVLGGRDVTRMKPAVRSIGYVPQDLALFSTMTVEDHLGFALRIRGSAKPVIRARVEELAALLGIAHLLGRRPRGLSGGESQRVALGRALSAHPNALCLDEPLSALDEETHAEICGLLKRIQRETGVTVLHITHSASEAERLADRIFYLRDGRIETVDRSALQPEDAAAPPASTVLG